MTKLHITATAVILSALLLLGGCSDKNGDHGAGALLNNNSSDPAVSTDGSSGLGDTESADSSDNSDTTQMYYGEGFISYVPVVSAVDAFDIAA